MKQLRLPPVSCICPICQASYIALAYQVRHGRKKTCSPACAKRLRVASPTFHQRYEKRRVPLKTYQCTICFTSFEAKPSRIRGGHKKTCSHACGMILRKQNVGWQSSIKPRVSPEHTLQRKRRKNARYRAKNRAALNAKQAAYLQANPEVKHRAQVKRRTRRWKTAIRDFTLAQWRTLKDLYEHRCAYCGDTFERLTMDHVIALCEGGNHTLRNIVPACRSCNCSKGRRALPLLISPEHFYDLIEG